MNTNIDLLKVKESTKNGENFYENPILRDLYNKVLGGLFVYNLIIRRPKIEHETLLIAAGEAIKAKIGFPEDQELNLESLMKFILNFNIHAGSYFYAKGKVKIGPNIGSVDAKEFTHTEISKRYLRSIDNPNAITGYCLFEPLTLGDYTIDGIYVADNDISEAEFIEINAPEIAGHPLCLVEVDDEEGTTKLCLFVSSELDPFRFKKPKN